MRLGSKKGVLLGGQSGLSMLEVTVMSGALLGAISVSTKLITDNVLSQRRLKNMMAYTQLVNFVRSSVSDQNNCAIALGLKTQNPNTGGTQAGPASITLSVPGKTQIKVYTPAAETFEKNDIVGAVRIADLSITLDNSPGIPIPDTNDSVYYGTLSLLGEKLKNVSSGLPVASIPISVQLNQSKKLLACSSYRNPKQQLIQSPPCNSYSSSMFADQSNIKCIKSLCQSGESPTGFEETGEVRCASLPTCTGDGKALVNIKGEFKCKQITCPQSNKPLTKEVDSDGFISKCGDMAEMIMDCQEDQTKAVCKPLYDESTNPGATKGFFCNTAAPENAGKMCKEDCALKNAGGAVCKLLNNVHTADECLTNGGKLAVNPSGGGGLVCRMPKASGVTEATCWSGWTFYGKNYTNDMPGGICPRSVPHRLDWHGRDACWPNCAGQADTFPREFEFPNSNTCLNGIIAGWDKKQLALHPNDPSLRKPYVDVLLPDPPSGFYPAAQATIDISHVACVMSIDCKLCLGNYNQMTQDYVNFNKSIEKAGVGFLELVGLLDSGTVADIQAKLNEGRSPEDCFQPNVSYVFSRCDLNCYMAGTLSSCKLEPSTKLKKVNISVETYCY